MTDKVFILSTMTNDVAYQTYVDAGGVPHVKERIVIRGGAGLPSLRSGFGEVTSTAEGQPMWTADGIVTPIAREAYERVLKNHRVFQKHVKRGYIVVLDEDLRGNHKAVQKVVRNDMTPKDGFAQLTPSSYKGRVKVLTQAQAQASEDGHRL